jgi:phosphoribosylaminoimidazole-succinocarboxamide synthase
VIPIECVVRGYLEGSGWKEYQATGSVCGVTLPKGLKQCDKLPEPIFTPATKAAVGHDENIGFEQAAAIVGLETAGVLRELSLSIYKAAAEHALSRGIIIADTKFEFGVPLGEVGKQQRVWTPPMLVDEALTPDSSRFWPLDGYAPGRAQKSFDKQFLREYLETLVAEGKWNKTAPGPELPARVVEGTLARYREARERLCGTG